MTADYEDVPRYWADKKLALEHAARGLERLARVIRDRDLETFDDLTHDIMENAYCSYSQICVNVDLCSVREIVKCLKGVNYEHMATD